MFCAEGERKKKEQSFCDLFVLGEACFLNCETGFTEFDVFSGVSLSFKNSSKYYRRK